MSESQLTGLSPATLLLSDEQRASAMDKWGWVFYRCTYEDDDKWDSFKRIVTKRMRDSIDFYDTPDENRYLFDTLSMSFMEDAAVFSNASKGQLRAHFKKWARDAYYAENPRTPFGFDPRWNDPPRYRYFIQVDKDSLDAVTSGQPPGALNDPIPYVNYVDGLWKSYCETYALTQDAGIKADLDSELKENHEPVEGCAEFNVGWMMLDVFNIDVAFYHDIGGVDDEAWRIRYQRPPGICCW